MQIFINNNLKVTYALIKQLKKKNTANSLKHLLWFTHAAAYWPYRGLWWEKGKKGTRRGKEEITLSLFTGDIIADVENAKELPKRLLELIRNCSKFVGYNMQKSILFL